MSFTRNLSSFFRPRHFSNAEILTRRLNTVLQESEDALQQEFARAWAACKSAFGCSDHDVAAKFMALWRQPNNVNTVAGRSSVRRRNYLEDLKQSVIKGLRNKQGCNSIDISFPNNIWSLTHV